MVDGIMMKIVNNNKTSEYILRWGEFRPKGTHKLNFIIVTIDDLKIIFVYKIIIYLQSKSIGYILYLLQANNCR